MAGIVAAVGTTQATADVETGDGSVVPQLENVPDELAITSVIPHRRVGPDVDGNDEHGQHREVPIPAV